MKLAAYISAAREACTNNDDSSAPALVADMISTSYIFRRAEILSRKLKYQNEYINVGMIPKAK